MKTMRFLYLLAAIFCFSAPALARECICTESALDVRWHQAEAVFTGTVEDIKVLDLYVRPYLEDLPAAVRLRVDKGYKGAKQGEVFTLHTSLTRHTCTGHPFEAGKSYLVFAYRRKAFARMTGALYRFPDDSFDVAGLCGGTKPMGLSARPDLAALDAILQDARDRSLRVKIPRMLEGMRERK